MAQTSKPITDYIEPLQINGLDGRMLCLPAPKQRKREMLLLYGHHSTIERMMGIAEVLNKYGAVTLPDLPGMGGMDSFYNLGMKPSIDNMADYLATFIAFRYRRKKVTIVAMSFSFSVATRMLQRHPELVNKVELLVSLVGFVHHDDFKFKHRNWFMMRYGASILSHRSTAFFFRYVILWGPFIRMAYRLVENKHEKLKDGTPEERRKRIDFEIYLWHANDVRTYMDTTITMLTLDVCNQPVNLPVWHITAEPDRFFDNQIVEQHLLIIFKEVHVILSKMAGHAPTVVSSAKEAAPFIPQKLRRLLAASK